MGLFNLNYNNMVEALDKPSVEMGKVLDSMEEFASLVSARTALAAYKYIHSNIHRNFKGTIDERKKQIDYIATQEMSRVLHEGPFFIDVVSGEGAKDNSHFVKGVHGAKTNHKLYGANDPVEGTSFADIGENGAWSVLALTEDGGIMATKPENGHYMVKLALPISRSEAFAAGISLKNDHEENLRKFLQVRGIRPDQAVQIMLNHNKKGREINISFHKAAEKLEIPEILIPSGDLEPGFLIAMEKKIDGRLPIIVGRGGIDEAKLNAAIIKATGKGFMQAQEFNQNPEIMARNPVFNLDDLIPSHAKNIAFAGSLITDGKWIQEEGVRKNNNGSFTVNTLLASHREVRVVKHTFN